MRERVDRVTRECAEAIAEVIHEDTGLPDEQSRLLAVSLVGMAQVSARFWLDTGGEHRPGRRGYAGGRPGLARHPRLPAHRRAGLTRTDGHPRDTTGGPPVEVKIGVQNASRELVIDSARVGGRRREGRCRPALAGDERRPRPHRHQGPPGRWSRVDKLAYVEIGTAPTAGQVGFRS